MAKRPPVDPKVLKLFTKAERQVLDASRSDHLETVSAAELGRLLARARMLRDKWRDQFRTQRRTTQVAVRARGAEGNERSREKAELFADAVDRLEARLAAAGLQSGAAVTSGRRAAAAAKTPKTARALANRSARASTRQALAKHASVKPSRRSVGRPTKLKALAVATAKPKPAKKPSTKAAEAAEADDTRTAKKAKQSKNRSKKRLRGEAPAALEAVATRTKGQGRRKAAGLDPLSQLKVATKVKSTLFRIAGADTRTRSHVRAQGKRQQSRRDSRSR
jgi:hypothetical protein